jgi:hypothetical protein
MQDGLLTYLRRGFAFASIEGARDGDPMHFHAYRLRAQADDYRLSLAQRLSTDSAGVATSLGLQASPRVELVTLFLQIEAKLPASVLLSVPGTIPVPPSADAEADEDI